MLWDVVKASDSYIDAMDRYEPGDRNRTVAALVWAQARRRLRGEVDDQELEIHKRTMRQEC